MAVSVIVGGDGPFQLSTNGGWTTFIEWAERLPGEFTAIRSLAEVGEWTGTDELLRQLSVAEVRRRPPAPLARTLAEFKELVGVGDPDEIVEVLS